jgi:hypothetical protein
MREISWLSEDLYASEEGLCYMELVARIGQVQATAEFLVHWNFNSLAGNVR